MFGRPGQALSLEEQLECAKLLREEHSASRSSSRGTGARGDRRGSRGSGTRGGHGGFRASASGTGSSFTRGAHRHPTASTSSPTSVTTQDTSRQGTRKQLSENGGFLSGIATAAALASKTSTRVAARDGGSQCPKASIGNNILPHLRHTLHMGDTSSSATSHQLTSTNMLQNITNVPQRLAPGSGDSGEPAKLIQAATNTSDVKKEPTPPFQRKNSRGSIATSSHAKASSPGLSAKDPAYHGNELIKDISSQATNTAGTMPHMSTRVPLTTLQPTTQVPISEQTRQLHYPTRNVSNPSDVKMAGIDTRIDEEPRPTSRKHGGMAESDWAKAFNQAPAVPQHVAADPFEKRWIPTRVSEPTPTPAHLLPQQLSEASKTTATSTQVSGFVPRSTQGAQQLNSGPSTGVHRSGRKGGLASSQWAS